MCAFGDSSEGALLLVRNRQLLTPRCGGAVVQRGEAARAAPTGTRCGAQ